MSMQDHPEGTMPAGVAYPEPDTLPIYEVARELGLAQHVMRMWEARFPQLRPLRGPGGRRSYRAHDIAVLRQIANLLYVKKLSLAQAQAELARSQLANSTLSSAPTLEAVIPAVESGSCDAIPPAGMLPPVPPHEAPAAPLQVEIPAVAAPMLVVEQVTAVTEVVPAPVAAEDVASVPAAARPAAGDEAAAGTEPASRPAAIMPVQADMADNEDAEPPLEQLVMIELERLQAENAVLRDSLRGVLVELQALREMVPV
ncbi:transcriptional regulator [Komagataeibacter rhaeticus]|uniref:MerR family transcriptional regulator n=1 Tax=Komagataeibacter rhaeticus TaxID=215221 RepID=UPI0004D83630|nr:MerR family transcriptional regulator [Komagataeibacter rhaeticus]KDU95646.1 transcriptional regulator [Komagataeibacter rhaeticus AF1]MBL7239474.1 MerR family transcriptional regulator [Komagataeibacter rhaeticus]PYD54528.1 transcriptional regulator [Komagataeibacter rhaeticus]